VYKKKKPMALQTSAYTKEEQHDYRGLNRLIEEGLYNDSTVAMMRAPTTNNQLTTPS